MNNEQVFCSIQGHQGHQVTHICIFIECNHINRLMCQKCIDKNKHKHDKMEFIKIENSKDYFLEYFNEQRLPELEQRLKSQNDNQVKYNYLTKVYLDLKRIDENVDNLSQQQGVQQFKQTIEKIKLIISELIDGYQNEIIWAQQIENTYQKLIFSGLESLNKDQLNDLLNCHRKFFNKEIFLYQKLNLQLDAFNTCELTNQDLLNNVIDLCQKLNQISEYLDFQQSERFCCEQFLNSSFFSKDDKYFALVYEYNKINIRNQRSLNLIQQIIYGEPICQIQFDSFFIYFVVLDNKNYFKYYIKSKDKKFKMIKSFRCYDKVDDFFLQNFNNIIAIYPQQYRNTQIIRTFNFKNVCVNQIKVRTPYNYPFKYCYGRDKNIIATYSPYFQEIQIYNSKQQNPFICMSEDDLKISEMTFINNDLELLTQNKTNVTLWEVNYQNQQLIRKNEIEKDQYHMWHIMNQTEFQIIKSNSYEMEIQDKNFKLWLMFSDVSFNKVESVYLTKYFIIMNISASSHDDYSSDSSDNSYDAFYANDSCKIILRKKRNDFDQLKYNNSIQN